MFKRRDLLKGLAVAPFWAADLYAQATRGLPPLKIERVDVIGTSPRGYRWVFIKVHTSEPGLYGVGSANYAYLSWAAKEGLEKHMAPFWVGKDPDRIEDLWQWNHVRSYWRNGPITNVIQAALDSALWDIKGKRANMPVYQLLGGKVRDAVPLYAYAGGPTMDACVESAQSWMEKGFRHVRVQMGGYGGGGFIPPTNSSSRSSRAAWRGAAAAGRVESSAGVASPFEIRGLSMYSGRIGVGVGLRPGLWGYGVPEPSRSTQVEG